MGTKSLTAVEFFFFWTLLDTFQRYTSHYFYHYFGELSYQSVYETVAIIVLFAFTLHDLLFFVAVE